MANASKSKNKFCNIVFILTFVATSPHLGVFHIIYFICLAALFSNWAVFLFPKFGLIKNDITFVGLKTNYMTELQHKQLLVAIIFSGLEKASLGDSIVMSKQIIEATTIAQEESQTEHNPH